LSLASIYNLLQVRPRTCQMGATERFSSWPGSGLICATLFRDKRCCLFCLC